MYLHCSLQYEYCNKIAILTSLWLYWLMIKARQQNHHWPTLMPILTILNANLLPRRCSNKIAGRIVPTKTKRHDRRQHAQTLLYLSPIVLVAFDSRLRSKRAIWSTLDETRKPIMTSDSFYYKKNRRQNISCWSLPTSFELVERNVGRWMKMKCINCWPEVVLIMSLSFSGDDKARMEAYTVPQRLG